ncbi:MAG: hypothetical protein GTO14_09455 [Anaerolineales bacterium]|nr:hypothetical protein [Anaerolineales bacterium]
MQSEWVPIRFIDVEIEVTFDLPPVMTKKPDAPNAFYWGDEQFRVVEVLSMWFDYRRRGDTARNMAEHNLRVAERRGSWGVGRFYFRVRTEGDRIFDLYFDRAPKKAADRKGHWYLWRELKAA